MDPKGAFQRLDDRLATDDSSKVWIAAAIGVTFAVTATVLAVIHGTAKPLFASLPFLAVSLAGTRWGLRLGRARRQRREAPPQE